MNGGKDRLVLRTQPITLMRPQRYQFVLKRQLNARKYLLLRLLVTVVYRYRDVRLANVAEALPLPILFEAR